MSMFQLFSLTRLKLMIYGQGNLSCKIMTKIVLDRFFSFTW